MKTRTSVLILTLLMLFFNSMKAQWSNTNPPSVMSEALIVGQNYFLDFYNSNHTTTNESGISWTQLIEIPTLGFIPSLQSVIQRKNSGLEIINYAEGHTLFKGTDNDGINATLKVIDTGSDSMLIDANEIDVVNGSLYLNHNVSNNVYIGTGGGNVGIGTTSPAQKLHVNGDAVVEGFLADPSDVRLKKNVQPLENALANILSLQPVRYQYRTNTFGEFDLPQSNQTGLLAQEVANVIPEVVLENALKDEEGENYMGVDYKRIVPHLIGAIKEQQDVIQEIQSANKSQQLLIQTLMTRIKRLENKSTK